MEHDITLRIPEGAIVTTKKGKVHLEIGVAMYGPFSFPDNTRPISPILWLCPVNVDTKFKLKKPFQVVLPHYLRDKVYDYGIKFAKVEHENFNESKKLYEFGLSEEAGLVSKEGQGYGIAEMDHFCYICLTAEDKANITNDTSYCLTRIEHILQSQRHEVIFCTSYYLPTCLQVLSVSTDNMNLFLDHDCRPYESNFRATLPFTSHVHSNSRDVDVQDHSRSMLKDLVANTA